MFWAKEGRESLLQRSRPILTPFLTVYRFKNKKEKKKGLSYVAVNWVPFEF
jgi:hypothetical protein